LPGGSGFSVDPLPPVFLGGVVAWLCVAVVVLWVEVVVGDDVAVPAGLVVAVDVVAWVDVLP